MLSLIYCLVNVYGYIVPCITVIYIIYIFFHTVFFGIFFFFFFFFSFILLDIILVTRAERQTNLHVHLCGGQISNISISMLFFIFFFFFYPVVTDRMNEYNKMNSRMFDFLCVILLLEGSWIWYSYRVSFILIIESFW